MNDIENNIEVLEEKKKIKVLKKCIQNGLELLQKYEAEVQRREKLKVNKKLEDKKIQKKSQKKQNPKKETETRFRV